MNEALQEGIDLLNTAGNDKRLLGMALLSIHGALEAHFREKLSSEIAQFEQQNSRAGWQDLLNLWEQTYGLTEENKKLILAKNTLRNKVAHAQPYYLTRTELESYSWFVQDFIGVHLSPTQNITSFVPSPPANETDFTEIITDDSFPTTSPRRPIGWIVFTAVLLLVAFATFLIWNSWIASLLLTAVLFLLVRRRHWLFSGYLYLGGLMLGYAQAIVGWSFLIATIAALCWPLSAGIIYWANRSGQTLDPALIWEPTDSLDTIEANSEPLAPTANSPEVQNLPGEELEAENMDVLDTAVDEPAADQPTATTETQLEVIGNSNVRAEPDVESAIVGYAQIGETYAILETMPDNSWYKIRLVNGNEGWIGSTRVRR